MEQGSSRDDSFGFLSADGEMADRIRAFDWSTTTLGAPGTWPLAIRAALAIILDAPAPMAIWAGDRAETLIQLYNDPFRALLAERHPAALGASLRDLWPDRIDAAEPELAAILAGGPVQYAVDQLVWLDRDDGPEPMWFTYGRSPIREADGRIVGVLTTAADTSERVLEQRRQRFVAAFDAVAQRTDALDALLEAGLRLLGEALGVARAAYADEDAAATATRAEWHRDDPAVAPIMQARLRVPITTEPGSPGSIVVEQPGPRHWRDEDVDLLREAGCRLHRAISQRRADAALRARAAARDAALAEAEAEREAAASLYRAYFDNTTDAVFIVQVTDDGGFVFDRTNPANATNNGFSTELVRGRTASELFPPETAERIEANYRRCVVSGEALHYVEEMMMPAGYRHFETSLVPLRNPAGRITGIWGGARDITDRVRLEEALRQGQKMQAVGQLAGGIAHDFNNLLGAIIGSLDLVQRRGDLDDRVRRYVDNAFAAAERGAKLTGQLLAFARAQRLQLQPVIAADLIEGMRGLLARTLGPNIALHFDLRANRAPVLTDPTQLELAILNLAINARDAMPDGGTLSIGKTLVHVHDDPDLADGEYVELTVTDTGQGMAPDVAARAFDPFFTTKRVGEGTGLGLSQVYGIAQQAGGTARIDSTPGGGTRVRLYLRRVAAGEAVLPASSRPEAPELRPLSVLVIDDDTQMRRFLADSLEALGHRVAEAADGATGLAAIEAAAPDVVIVDFALPDINGAEVARNAWLRRPELPLVFASGFSDTKAIEAVAGDKVAVLRKPFRVDELQAAIATALAR